MVSSSLGTLFCQAHTKGKFHRHLAFNLWVGQKLGTVQLDQWVKATGRIGSAEQNGT